MNVTLREVAAELKRSYGNITYHYPGREELIVALFADMNEELKVLQQPPEGLNLLRYFLQLPEMSYAITLKYLFFTVDYLELKRHYPEFYHQVNALNEARKVKWLALLQELQCQGFLNPDLSEEDLQYIMFLSASVRINYFQFLDPGIYSKLQYIITVNQLLKPYLTEKG